MHANDWTAHFNLNDTAVPPATGPFTPICTRPSDGVVAVTRIQADMRAWLPGVPIELAGVVGMPANVIVGQNVTLSLWLPDKHTALRDEPRYSIQLATEGVVDGAWHASVGHNVIADVEVV